MEKNLRSYFGIIADQSGYLAYCASVVTVLVLSIHNQFTPPFMIAWTLFWAINYFYRKSDDNHDEIYSRWLMLSFVLLNLIFYAGLIYSSDKKEGIVLLFRRFSLLIYPMILFSPGRELKKNINTLLKFFAIGISFFLIICFVYALIRSIKLNGSDISFVPFKPDEPWVNFFYGEELSLDQHPSYIALYALFGMFVSLESASHTTSNKRKFKHLWYSIGLFLFISVFFLSSRASFIAISITLPFYILVKIRKRKRRILIISTILALTAGLVFLFLHNQKIVFYLDKSINPASKNDGRLEYWSSALKVIKKNPVIGVGMGDYYAAMDKEYKKSGYSTGYYSGFNAHNEFLEITLSSGVIGLLVFLVIIGLMAYIAYKDRNLLYAIFLIMMLIFLSFESMLSRIAGNTFFSLFSFLLLHYKGYRAESELGNKIPVTGSSN